MTPMFGLIASSISGNLSSNFDSIQTVTVGAGGQASISFTSIPSIYKHLQVRWIGRITAATTDENLQIQVGNSTIDTGANYSLHGVYGIGSGSGSAFGNANTSGANLGRLTGASSTSNMFGAGVIDILDYGDSNKYKTFRSIAGDDQNGSGLVWFASGNWRSTSAINTIQFNQLYGSGNFAQYSSFALYGIKG